jgi:hypothetical protein
VESGSLFGEEIENLAKFTFYTPFCAVTKEQGQEITAA